jgi:adenosylhomocysteine nucleosidase
MPLFTLNNYYFIMKKLFILLFITFQIQAQKPITAILGAFSQEIKLLEDSLQHKSEVRIKGIRFLTGELRGRSVVIALTGVGKVNAAMTSTILLMNWNPEQLIFTGIAGGIHPNLLPGDIVIASTTFEHDYGKIDSTGFTLRPTRNPTSGELNPIYFPADDTLLQKAQTIALQTKYKTVGNRTLKVITGIIATGDVFVNANQKVEELRTKFRADATEMEGAAVAQVCFSLKIPCLVIRSISDNANAKAQLDMKSFEYLAAYNSASLVLGILNNLNN